MLLSRKRCCRICGSYRSGPHHIIPVEEGGISCSDNIVWLCEPHHNQIEAGPYNWTTAKKRIEDLRHEYQHSKRKEARVRLDYQPSVVTDDSLIALRKKRIAQGYLDPDDSKKYQMYWMEPESWRRLWNER